MKNFAWIETFDYNKFLTPFLLDSDNEYFGKLKNKLKELVDELELRGAESDIIDVARRFSDRIIDSIELYYKGDIIKSQTIINELINEFPDDNEYAISGINTGSAFPGYSQETLEVQFFRARLNDRVEDYPARQMLHIPFSKREIVKSERFSIPGLPCLYLGNSSYACWIEMGRPADYQFNVSPVVLDNTQKVLNLAVSIRDLQSYQELDKKVDISEFKNDIVTLLKLVILNICTSYKIQNRNRNFKSEYIISQMIMLACKNRGLDGVAYLSKQVSSEVFASIVGVNVALFAKYNGEDELSEICEHIKIGDSFNYSMYKKLLPSLKYKGYRLRIDASPYINNIGSLDRQFPYKETEFYDFDKYLFANWNRE